MDKQQIIDYIMHTPSNTNPAMLGQFLDEYSGGSGESWTTLFEDEITTEEGEGQYFALSISDYIDADKIKVTFNGVEYICNKTVIEADDMYNVYGGSVNEEDEFDFSNYPFLISSMYIQKTGKIFNSIVTETPGTHSIKIEVPQEGGGSGDWSTAEVTFINHTVISGTVRCVGIDMSQNYLCVDDVIIPSANEKMIPPYSTTICLIPLYKNRYKISSLDFSEDFSDTLITTTGNITDGEGEYLITGNCTITFNAGESAPVTPAQ